MDIKNGINLLPAVMWGLGMFVNSVQGEDLTDEQLETYGVDWDGLENKQLVQANRENNSQAEEASS
jgi:hypothetical protein